MDLIAVILMPGTPQAKSRGSAFALGWVLGLVIVNVIVASLGLGALLSGLNPSLTDPHRGHGAWIP
ncbi:hypothetical protein [Janibacter cremeus]|uniref:Uncharacterized protein n=1 Tax=Janibacter cremeus TaxID=1285192 RepID=A0A852VJK2_9MICO|nr:hypothetical protein [Janibacter cremeus]NYF97287.1 hypothetical protein [Janibacter cremeus]